MAEQHGKTLVPQIRFAGFTDPWEQRKLGDVANVCSGRDYKHLAEGPIPVYGTGGYMTSVSKALSYDEDAIGIGRKGTIDKPYRLQAPFWTVDTLFYAIPEASSDINFLLCSFLNVDWKSKDESTGLPSLSKRAINETEVLVPDNGEQRQIGAFFDRLDSLITLHQRKLESLRNIKKSMLDKMFPKGGSLYPEIRFAGFTDPWEQRKLGEFGSVAMCKRIYKEQTSEQGDVPFFKIGTFGANPDAFISNELFEDFKRIYPYPTLGTLLISAAGSIGRVVEYQGEKAYFQDSNIVWLEHDHRLNDAFLKPLYSRIEWGLEGSTIKRLYNKDLLSAEVTVPGGREQKEIGQFFAKLDKLITLHQRKLELLRNIKKSMLDKMFV